MRLSHLNESEGERNQQLSIQLKVNLKKHGTCSALVPVKSICAFVHLFFVVIVVFDQNHSCNQKSGDYNLFASLNQCSLFLQSALNYNAGLHLHF